MTRKLKFLFWTIMALVVVAIAGWNMFMNFVAVAFGEDCEVVRVWKIESYDVVEKRCIGFAGPPFHPMYLYKDNMEIDQLPYMGDSCLVEFINDEGDTLSFDLCSNKMENKKETAADKTDNQ